MLENVYVLSPYMNVLLKQHMQFIVVHIGVLFLAQGDFNIVNPALEKNHGMVI